MPSKASNSKAVSKAGAMQPHWCSETSFKMCLHLFMCYSHTGKQTRIATHCKSIGRQAQCPRLFTLRCREDPCVAPRNQCTCLTTQQHGSYSIRALSSPCFLFSNAIVTNNRAPAGFSEAEVHLLGLPQIGTRHAPGLQVEPPIFLTPLDVKPAIGFPCPLSPIDLVTFFRRLPSRRAFTATTLSRPWK